MKISVMSLTNRAGGIDILWANLKRQTFEDWELVLVDALWKDREKEIKEYINDPRLKYIRQPDKPKGAYTGLAHADNIGFKACDGELIISLQDYQWVPPEGFEKFWMIYEKDPRALVTGVGHHYSDPRPVNNNGKITVFDKPYTRRPETLSWPDPRMDRLRPQLSPAQAVEWELSYASLPKQVIYDVGGMDEQFDFEGFAWDNTYIAYKCQLLGSKIYLDQSNEIMGFDHDLWWPNPLKVDRVTPDKYFHKKIQGMIEGKIPIKDKYL